MFEIPDFYFLPITCTFKSRIRPRENWIPPVRMLLNGRIAAQRVGSLVRCLYVDCVHVHCPRPMTGDCQEQSTTNCQGDQQLGHVAFAL